MLERFLVLQTRSFEEHRVAARIFTPEVQSLELLAKRPFNGTIAAFPFGTTADSTVLGSATATVELFAMCHPIEAVRVLVPITTSFRIDETGRSRDLSGGGRAVLMSASGVGVSASPGRFLEFRVQRPRIATVMDLFECDAEIGTVLDAAAFDPRIDGLRHLSDHVRHVVGSVDHEPAGIVDLAQFRAAHEQLLVLRLARVIANAAGLKRHRGVRRNGAAMSRAIEFIRANADRDVDLAALARHVGLSLRTLQLLFRSELDCTIVQYIREHRLGVARERLERAEPNQTIAEIACGAGFSHLGEFSRLYRQRFGELPSETLQRARRHPLIWTPQDPR
jgi:AraC-like DNA-binding protein